MKKVLCIQVPKDYDPSDGNPIVKEGGVYTVADNIGEFYELSEHEGYIYASNLFIPLSDIDETEYADEVLVKMFQPVKF